MHILYPVQQDDPVIVATLNVMKESMAASGHDLAKYIEINLKAMGKGKPG